MPFLVKNCLTPKAYWCIVVMKPPYSTLPKVGRFRPRESRKRFSLPSKASDWQCDMQERILCGQFLSYRRNKSASSWCWTSPDALFGSCWKPPLTWLLLWFWVVTIAATLITRNYLRNAVFNSQLFFHFTTGIHSRLLLTTREQTRHRFSCNSSHSRFFNQDSLSWTPRHTCQINKLVNCTATVFHDHFMNFSVFFHQFGRLQVALNGAGLPVTFEHS